MGYVGLPLSFAFCKKGIHVIGFDTNEKIIDSLKESKSYINHISSNKLKNYINNKLLVPTNNFENIKNVDVIIICVPTPLNKNKSPDLNFIKSSLNSIRGYLHEGQALILESTTYPGTTEEVIKPFIQNEGLDIGKKFLPNLLS